MNPDAIRTRLLTLAKEQGSLYDLLLRQYAQERFLHRLASSRWGSDFVLAGGSAIELRLGAPHRRVTTVDLLCRREATERDFLAVIQAIGGEEDDGLVLDSESIRTTAVSEGTRVKLFAYLGTAQIPIQIDIGFGDLDEHFTKKMQIPSMLDQPGSESMDVARYETILAEAVAAIVKRGAMKIRMAHIYDAWMVTQVDPIDRLDDALMATFQRRGTPLPTELPHVLSDGFAAGDHARHHWAAFVARYLPVPPVEIGIAVTAIREVVEPLFGAPTCR